MIKECNAKKYCCEDISLIENYQDAINSNESWDCHHRLEIELNKSSQELKDLNLYYNRPASELIFLTDSEHKKIHGKSKVGIYSPQYGKKRSNETREKMRLAKINKKRKPFTDEHKQHISESLKGKPSSLLGIPRSEDTKEKIRLSSIGRKLKKYKWLTPSGEIKIMNKSNVTKHHPDWILIED